MSRIRKASIKDIAQIRVLINDFAKDDLMLPRSLNELYETVRDFWVCEDKGKILGCCALHICWDTLAEIKSLAVRSGQQGRGIGSELVQYCIDEALGLEVKKIFVLTYQSEFFKKFHFRRVKHEALPHKIWAECINCPKFPGCNEIAMVRELKKTK
ncbi:MAG: N-acetyltransferase [Candidatus Omnitrophota bacterium]|jgi:amino-acid N-acetyltransferase